MMIMIFYDADYENDNDVYDSLLYNDALLGDPSLYQAQDQVQYRHAAAPYD